MLTFFDYKLISIIFLQNLIDSKLYALLGEKTAADNEKPVKKKKEKPVKVVEVTISS